MKNQFVNHLSRSPCLELGQTLTTCESAAPMCELVTDTNWLSVCVFKKNPIVWKLKNWNHDSCVKQKS